MDGPERAWSNVKWTPNENDPLESLKQRPITVPVSKSPSRGLIRRYSNQVPMVACIPKAR